MMSYTMEYPFGQLRQAVPAVSSPNLLPIPSLFPGRGRMRNREDHDAV